MEKISKQEFDIQKRKNNYCALMSQAYRYKCWRYSNTRSLFSYLMNLGGGGVAKNVADFHLEDGRR